jgi:type I restriction enzyme R subunit
VNERFDAWMTQQLVQGRQFTLEQRQWLELIRDHIAASLGVEAPDFDLAPFSQRGGLGKAYQLFGNELSTVLAELNEALVA